MEIARINLYFQRKNILKKAFDSLEFVIKWIH